MCCSVTSYSTRFLDQVEATKQVFGRIVITFDIEDEPNSTEEQMKNQNRLLTYSFLAGFNWNRYKTVIDDLGNDFQLEKVAYPEDVIDIKIQLLSNRHGINTSKAKQIEDIRDGVLMNQLPPTWGYVSEVCNKQIGQGSW
jgi:hypothetical protein